MCLCTLDEVGPVCSEGSYSKGAPLRLFSYSHTRSLHLCAGMLPSMCGEHTAHTRMPSWWYWNIRGDPKSTYTCI